MTDATLEAPIAVGRYLLHREIARGGMATIHIARVLGDVGFSRIVAAKRLRPELAEDREFVSMFLDEARIASKVNHRNVVPVLDVGTTNGEVVLVQEYVHGAPLSLLLRAAYQAKTHVPVPVAVSIACHVLAGLHAAHETTDELGTPLRIVHRDVSPQNIMVATDGTARLLDFGIAKAAASGHVTRKGTFKGKLAYAAPEQLRGKATRQSDIYALSVVLWELVVGDRLFRGARTDEDLIAAVMSGATPSVTVALANQHAWIGSYRWHQLEALAPIIARGLTPDLGERWATAAEMEEALGAAVPLPAASDVTEWLRALGGDFLAERDRMIAAEEASWRSHAGHPPRGPTVDDDMAIATAIDLPREPDPEPSLRSRVLAHTPSLAAGAAVIFSFIFIAAALTSRPPVPVPVPVPDLSATPAASPPPPPPPLATVEPPSHPAPRPLPPPPQRVAPPAPVPTRIVRAPPPPPRATPPVAVPISTPPPATMSTPPPAVDCNPPYYFEGAKKIFKPRCL